MSDSTDEIEVVIEDEVTAPEVIEIAPEKTAQPVVKVDDAVADLQRQLAEAKATALRATTDATAARQETAKFRTTAEQAQYDAVSRALEAQNGAVESAETSYQSAMESGDWKAAAKAQTLLAKAVQRQTALEDGKAHMETVRASPQYQQQQQTPTDTFEARIATLSPRTRDWVRQHPDAITDPTKSNKVMAAHYSALDKGIQPDTDAYFAHVEEASGYRKAPISAPARPVNQSAPVLGQARQPAGAQTNSQRVVMTPKMQSLARDSGLSDVEWAKYYLRGLKDGTQEPIH